MQNWQQHAQSIGGQDGGLRDLGDVFVLRYRDGKAGQAIHVHHDVYIRTAIADVHNPVMTERQRGSQVVQDRHLSVSGWNASDGLDLAGSIVTELRTDYVVIGDYVF